MSIKINNENIFAIAKGSQQITYVYKGDFLVWQLVGGGYDERMVEFVDPEVIRILKEKANLTFDGNKAKMKDIKRINTLNPSGNNLVAYFYNNKVIKRFPELKYFTGITDLSYNFGYSTNLTEITIPNRVTKMFDTFTDCTSLLEAPAIPEGVTIMDYAFNGCSSLKSAPIIPSTVKDFYYTFRWCFNLTGPVIVKAINPPNYIDSFSPNLPIKIYVPNNSVNRYKTASGWSEYADKIYPISEAPYEFSGNFTDPEVGRLLISNFDTDNSGGLDVDEIMAITNLGDIFDNNDLVTTLEDLDTFTALTDIKLIGLSNLTSIQLPSSVVKLKIDNLPLVRSFKVDNVETLWIKGVFKMDIPSLILNTSTLKNVRVDNINTRNQSFSPWRRIMNSNLRGMNPDGTTCHLGDAISGDVHFNEIKSTDLEDLQIYFPNLTITSNNIIPMFNFADPEVGRVLKSKGAIADANFTSIKELATITTLRSSGNYTNNYFYVNTVITKFPELKYCTGLRSLYYAFYGCSNLTEIGDTIPDSVTSMDYTFYGCSNLRTAPVIPAGVTKMFRTFSGCRKLNGVYIIKAITPPKVEDGYPPNLQNRDPFEGAPVSRIYVPDESVNSYKYANIWYNYRTKIFPMSELPK